MKVYRFGIAGPGVIAEKFVQGLMVTSNVVLAAAASKNISRAETFLEKYASKYPDTKAYGNYEEMARDPDIDAVYISNLNDAHCDTAMLFLNHKKPVICEKPFALNAMQVSQMIDCARLNNVLLMEAMWTRFLPVTERVVSWINDGRIGVPMHAISDFGMALIDRPEHRTLSFHNGGGALLDLGVYPISFFNMIFGGQPMLIQSMVAKANSGVDIAFDAVFRYKMTHNLYGEDHVTAYTTVSIDKNMTNRMLIIGSLGSIEITNFFAGQSAALYRSVEPAIVIEREPVEIFLPERVDLGYSHEIKSFVNCLDNNWKENPIMPLSDTLDVMKTMDLMRLQWQMKFPQEN